MGKILLVPIRITVYWSGSFYQHGPMSGYEFC